MRPLDPATPLFLVKAGALSTASDSKGVTPVDIAVRYGCTAIVRAMFSAGRRGSAQPRPPRPTPCNVGLLYQAVTAGNVEIVDVLVRGGWEAGVPTPSVTAGGKAAAATPIAAPTPSADTTPVGATGRALSPLMLAADSGNPDVVKALLRGRNKGYPNTGDERGYRALHFATMRGSADIAGTLVGEGGADPNVRNVDGDTPLHIAVATKMVHVGQVLLRAGASVDAVNSQGHTALHFAAALGLAGFAKELVDRGADFGAVDGLGGAVNPSDGDGGIPDGSCGKERSEVVTNALGSSSGNEHKVVAKLPGSMRAGKGTILSSRKSRRLEEKGNRQRGRSLGSNPSPPRKEGRTALHYAAMNGRTEAVQVLLHAGAAAGHQGNGKRESPLFVAAKNGHAEVVGLLLEDLRPGDVDVPALSGETPLSVACANGHVDVVNQVTVLCARAF